MAFIGHPILADIRKGIRLRPTQTVDKSRPMIQAEGESLGAYRPRGPEQYADDPPISPPPPPAQYIPCPPPAPSSKSPFRPPPPCAPPPPAMAQSNGNNKQQMEENQRQKLLAQIRGGVRLRHVQTVDKSGLVLDEQEKQQLLRATTPNGSLDSQGKSPSPSLASSSSMLSPSPAGGPIWPLSDSPSSDHFAPSPRNCSPSPVKHWPEVLTEKQKVEINGKRQSDFHFDEQKQIEERQKEVAALTGIGGARAAFQKFQGIQKQFPQPTMANQKMAATLPRAQKLGNGPTTMGRAKMVENGKGGGQKVNGNNGTKNGEQQQKNGETKQNWQRPAKNGQIQSQQQNIQRSNSSSLPTFSKIAHHHQPPPSLNPPPHPPPPPPPQSNAIPTNVASTASASSFFRSYTPRIGQNVGGAHRQNFERIRDRFTEDQTDGVGEKGAAALWKEAARQRKGGQQIINGKKSPIPPPLPNCPPPPLHQNGQQIPDWDILREQFKFAVDLDGGPEGTKLIRIVRR